MCSLCVVKDDFLMGVELIIIFCMLYFFFFSVLCVFEVVVCFGGFVCVVVELNVLISVVSY